MKFEPLSGRELELESNSKANTNTRGEEKGILRRLVCKNINHSRVNDRVFSFRGKFKLLI